MELSYIRTMSNVPILVKTPLIFPIPWAPAPFPKRGVRALITINLNYALICEKTLIEMIHFSTQTNFYIEIQAIIHKYTILIFWLSIDTQSIISNEYTYC